MTWPPLDFWYEFGSTYSYLSAMRIDDMAAKRGVSVRWRPFLLGPLFAKAGWSTSPFNVYPAKGAYMWRDMERLTSAMKLPLTRPAPFPANGLLAARVALAIERDEDRARFSRAVYLAEFGNGDRIDATETLAARLSALSLPADQLLDKAGTAEIKAALRANTETAERAGIFGAPSFTCADGELFWGNDRLESAIDHAASCMIV
ncbi:2-hydroxychromene-2-carboxylate isomerase [Stappia sp. ES.058]|uniref:2-hydroxychromene-2-carboxylate isomerase n=1 Tax=Stappia sp. ES.058 TaxID=1881061 RepID=UPI00087D123A|nr:2-hydroxychromene-2-carboxylate isomerase [Stappia sp. ES.058]SDU39815.1 2-hydroxychromene-2-carboxylate isomerase [Stappia sp. ES.058]